MKHVVLQLIRVDLASPLCGNIGNTLESVLSVPAQTHHSVIVSVLKKFLWPFILQQLDPYTSVRLTFVSRNTVLPIFYKVLSLNLGRIPCIAEVWEPLCHSIKTILPCYTLVVQNGAQGVVLSVK